MSQLIDLVREVASDFPDDLPDKPVSGYAGFCHPDRDVHRVAFDVELLLTRLEPEGATVVDLGGGIGVFSVVLAKLGARSVLIDKYFSPTKRGRHENLDQLRELWASYGVIFVNRDLIREGLGDELGNCAAVTNFHFAEHLHASPKRLFHDAVDRLDPGGAFLIAGPNCVNLRKRASAVLGTLQWSTMDAWYETEEFEDHVREPRIQDFEYIARDLGLVDVQRYGRNFLGAGRLGVRGMVARVVDPILRRRPSLCSDIYLIGQKPA